MSKEYSPKIPQDNHEGNSNEEEAFKGKGKSAWEKFKINFKTKVNHFKFRIKNEWKKILICYGIYLAVFIILVTIDLATKQAIFDWNQTDTPDHGAKSFVVIGTRSVAHHGVTLIPGNKGDSLIIFIQVISFIVLLALLTMPLIVNNKLLLVILSIIMSGDFGNMVDRFAFEGNVRDIFYTPWLDRGTFNFSDLLIVLGCVMMAIYFVASLFKDVDEKDKKIISHLDLESFDPFLGDQNKLESILRKSQSKKEQQEVIDNIKKDTNNNEQKK